MGTLLEGADDRFRRFASVFRALNRLDDLINTILDEHQSAFRIREGRERDVSLLVAASLGKGMKTFQAISRLCLLGYAQDALVLVRMNVNLFINTAYILAANDPPDRFDDFFADSYKRRRTYLRIGHDEKESPWGEPKMSAAEIEDRAEHWSELNIESRAKAVPKFPTWHYDLGYRYYSSFEHSDVFALNEYLDTRDGRGLTIQSGETDDHVRIALVHSYGLVADLLMLVCRYFQIERPEIMQEITETFAHLEPHHTDKSP